MGKRKLGVVLAISGIIVTSTLVLSFSKTTINFLGGDDCYGEHNRLFVGIFPELTYSSAFKPYQNITLQIRFRSGDGANIQFSVSSQLILQNDSLFIIEGNLVQSRMSLISRTFTVKWILQATREGFYPINVVSYINVTAKDTHPGYQGNYLVENTGAVQVEAEATEIPVPVTNSTQTELPQNPDNFGVVNLFLSQLTAYGSLVGFIVIALLASKSVQQWLTANLNISPKTIRQWHCNLAYLALLMAILHVILLIFTVKWGFYFNLFSLFLPSFDWISSSQLLVVGLDLGRIALIISIIVILGGIFFSRITARYGRQIALLTQKISYIGILAISAHALLSGSYAQNLVIRGILIALPIGLLILRIFSWWQNKGLSFEKTVSND